MQFTATVLTITALDKANEFGARDKYEDVIFLKAGNHSLELHVPADQESEGWQLGDEVVVTITKGAAAAVSAPVPVAPVSEPEPIVPQAAVTPSAGDPLDDDLEAPTMQPNEGA